MRVGCFLEINKTKKKAYFFGFGEYLGMEIPDENAGGLCQIGRLLGKPNPKILLDSGKIIWGGECWWSEEAECIAEIAELENADFNIINVDIDDIRKKWNEE